MAQSDESCGLVAVAVLVARPAPKMPQWCAGAVNAGAGAEAGKPTELLARRPVSPSVDDDRATGGKRIPSSPLGARQFRILSAGDARNRLIKGGC